jgi:hypothetical protein
MLELVTLGDDTTMPLGQCEGDCDADYDCLDDLICFQRDSFESVPGCSGNGNGR